MNSYENFKTKTKKVIILPKYLAKKGLAKKYCPVYQRPLYIGISASCYGRFTSGTC
jgi:hypothetical protein